MRNYLQLADDIMKHGKDTGNRTGIYARKLFGAQLRFDLQAGFPIVTTKRVHWRSVVGELLWMLRGDTNNNILRADNINIWNEWADDDGDLGPIYGKQWRDFRGADQLLGGVDQINETLELLRTYPLTRRAIISAWDPSVIPSDKITPQENVKAGKMALAPCHCMVQFDCTPLTIEERIEEGRRRNLIDIVFPEENPVLASYDEANRNLVESAITKKLDDANVPKYYLSSQMYQRSADNFLGTSFNIASYALLTHIYAKKLNMIPAEFVQTYGNVHFYSNHFDQVKLQLTREPYPLPELKIDDSVIDKDWSELQISDFELINYRHHPAIKGEVAV